MEWLQWSAREDWPMSSTWISVRPLETPVFEGCRIEWRRSWMGGHSQGVVVNCQDSMCSWGLVMSGLPQGFVLGLGVFNTFLSVTDKESSSCLQLAPSCRYSDTPEGWGTWTNSRMEPKEPNKVQQVQVPGGAPGAIPDTSTDWEKNSLRKGLWSFLVEYKGGHEPVVWAGSPEGQLHPGLHQKQGGRHVKGNDCSPLPCPQETPPGELHPTLGSPEQERCGPLRAGPEEATKMLRRLEHLCQRETGWESWGCWAWRGEGKP